jgi:molybdopterin synthase catalytic subunit
VIRIQTEDFDVGIETASLSHGNHSVGGVCCFVGMVRDIAPECNTNNAMTLEHYPGMTEKALAEIEEEAHSRWPLAETLIIHRYGRLEPGDRIVFVGTSSAHRDSAFDACRFLIDWLKTKAPFWKLEETGSSGHWVDARGSDDEAAARWGEQSKVAE